jgi:hypothetical protein
MKSHIRRDLSEADERRFWSKVALPDENGCMLWMAQIAPNGYGRFRLRRDESPSTASRISLQISGGHPPSSHHEAAHSCRNKHCVAPAHLRWATPLENQGDKIADGTSTRGSRHPGSKLTVERVEQILERLAAGVSQSQLARDYGVSQSAVWLISKGKSWPEVARADS